MKYLKQILIGGAFAFCWLSAATLACIELLCAKFGEAFQSIMDRLEEWGRRVENEAKR